MVKQLKLQAAATAAVIILILLAFTVSTYAWFTNSPDVYVQPMEGQIGRTDGSLLIASTPNGIFDVQCALLTDDPDAVMDPVSTADLTAFFSAFTQTVDERVDTYQLADVLNDSRVVHGHVYVRAVRSAANVYLDRENLNFGDDVQSLAAMRLGLRITTHAGVITRIFRLDDMMDLSEAVTRRTVPDLYADMVVSGTELGYEMVPDPALDISAYTAIVRNNELGPGANILFSLNRDETADVEFFLYLEGCDDQCGLEARNRSAALSLGFFGDMLRPDNRETNPNPVPNP